MSAIVVISKPSEGLTRVDSGWSDFGGIGRKAACRLLTNSKA
jgi:hypothetical protein